ncbi:MAG: VOC family protein [Pseudomonadota bacterium]
MSEERSSFWGVRYFEIPTKDLVRAISFYEALFQIELTRHTIDGYEMAWFPETADGQGASGALAQGDVYVPTKSGPILYFTISNLQALLDRLAALEATVLLEPREVQGQGVVAEFEDCEGNRIALFQPIEKR